MNIKTFTLLSLTFCAAVTFSACSSTSAPAHSPTPKASDNSQQDHTKTTHTMTVANDEEFLLGMIPHHQEAVDTSKYLLERTEDAELKAFLTDVIELQTKEIIEMKTWYIAFFGKEYAEDGKYIPMMGDLASVSGKELEKRYLEGMIAHHQGAIQMADSILPKAQHPEIKRRAEEIKATQTSEVQQMQAWLKNY